MEERPRINVAAIVGIVLLVLLPALYVGSYLALVDPNSGLFASNYRFGGTLAERAFWPLEQADRRIRPNTWDTIWLDLEVSVGSDDVFSKP